MNNQKLPQLITRNASLVIVVLIYLIISFLSSDKPYFWDNVQQTSKEAHWFYEKGFSSLVLPGFSENSEIVGTGYHPPLMGLMTALLWQIFGKHLWISHAFVLIWALLLIFFVFRLSKIFLPESVVNYALPVMLLEPTLLAQIYIASPDIVLLTSLVMALVAIFENRKLLLLVSLIFLVLINGRGMLTGGLLFIVNVVYVFAVRKEIPLPNRIIKVVIPYIPALTLLLGYFYLYFSTNGWFFSNADSPWLEEWQAPEGWREILKNIFAFGLRLIENGRIIIWLFALWLIKDITVKKMLKDYLGSQVFSLVLLTTMLFGLFLYFAVTTKMVIGSRYYMGLILLLTLIVFKGLSQRVFVKKIRSLTILMLFLLISGHFWIYPYKISKAWDATLAHIPYYDLREECINYLKSNQYDFSTVAGGFGFSGNQKYVDLKDRGVIYSNNPESEYFIYSDISNLPDPFLEALENPNKWQEIKTFKKGAVVVKLYKNLTYHEQ